MLCWLDTKVLHKHHNVMPHFINTSHYHNIVTVSYHTLLYTVRDLIDLGWLHGNCTTTQKVCILPLAKNIFSTTLSMFFFISKLTLCTVTFSGDSCISSTYVHVRMTVHNFIVVLFVYHYILEYKCLCNYKVSQSPDSCMRKNMLWIRLYRTGCEQLLTQSRPQQASVHNDMFVVTAHPQIYLTTYGVWALRVIISYRAQSCDRVWNKKLIFTRYYSFVGS